MTNLGLSRHALAIGAATALLAGCGGSQPPIGAPGATPQTQVQPTPMSSSNTVLTTGGLPHHRTFKYTGTEQTFKVPSGVTQITVVARGAAGGARGGEYAPRADGGRVYAVIPVIPGETLYVVVGGRGRRNTGGYNGGGKPGKDYYHYGFGGGGASDVRKGGDALGDRVLVAGGAGAEGDPLLDVSYPPVGGAGGGLTGGSGGGYNRGGSGGGGGGGTQSQGGAGGAGGTANSGSGLEGGPGDSGGLGSGGKGGEGGYSAYRSVSYLPEGGGGGGGGGGYYGGGGGGGGAAVDEPGNAWPGGGGGGGSSYVEPSAKKFRTWKGWKNATGNGLVVFSWQ